MQHLSRRAAVLGILTVLSACASAPRDRMEFADDLDVAGLHPNETPQLRQLINQYADLYQVPRPLVHRVIIRESRHRPGARNGPYYGLMQISHATARGMGYRGNPEGLLDAETNLKYAVKYLRGAWLVSDGSYDAAVGWYARGYYYEAKRRGLLDETGLRT